MIQSRKQLARTAIEKAMKARLHVGAGLESPICIFDICERFGTSVWFSDIPSMEGLYLPGAQPKPAIVVTSLRPVGRQSITCGHELGHHVFGHGEQWDELVEVRDEVRRFCPDEYQADLFSAALHMPKLAVCSALAKREINPARCSPEVIYALSAWFGVGYATLIMHMLHTLGLINKTCADDLFRKRPSEIRSEILGETCSENLFVVDSHWIDRSVDTQVGDLILAPAGSEVEGAVDIIQDSSSRCLIRSQSPGIGRVFNDHLEWATYIRVSRKAYIGRATFRFEEEVEEDVATIHAVQH